MKIFLSWSGERSKKMAEALKIWLPDVIQALNPWVSTHDIGKGSRGLAEIATELKGASFGIICVTPENQREEWINFEAGALSKEVDNALVVPLLLDLNIAELKGPLAQFQATLGQSRDDFARLMKDINDTLGVNQISPERLQRSFEKSWQELNGKFERIKATSPALSQDKKRSSDDVLAEILVLIRQQERRLTDIEGAIQRSMNVTSIETMQDPPRSSRFESNSVSALQWGRVRRKLEDFLDKHISGENHSYHWDDEVLKIYLDPVPDEIDQLRTAIKSIARQSGIDISVYEGEPDTHRPMFQVIRSR
ncbi:TIR domain-containing protein [Actinomadura macra]|uniref:TIR domain-containing protein n=1 Tax=Actinomadura macra TaxID=46164 RepID=UPI000A03433A|nr:TIR domain-containing protein [Actinomadura macra]